MMPPPKVAEKPRPTSTGRLKDTGLRGGRCPLSQPTKAPGITSLPLSGRAKSADRTRRPDRGEKNAHCSPSRVASAPSSAPSSAPTTARRQKLASSHSSFQHARAGVGEEALVLQKDLKKMEEKLATAERERDWAMNALRKSEAEVQKLMTQRGHQGDADAEPSDVRLNHYRVLLELLNLRCRLLEQWIEEEAALMAAQEEGHAEALRRMEQQVQELATEVVEQQAAFQEQVSTMSAQQERLEQQHCEDYSLWSEELLRGREKASEELVALREDLKRQEGLWHEEWVKMQQEALVQGINVPDPPGFLLQWLTAEESPGPCGAQPDERGRLAALLETIPEAAEMEEQAQTPNAAVCDPQAPEAAGKSDSSSVSFSEAAGKDKTCDSRTGSSAASPTSRSSKSASLCLAVPEDLVKGLDRASDKHQTSRAWARIGQFHQRQKCFEKARQAYQQAVSLDGTQHGCLANLAQLEAHAGNVSTAKEMLAAAMLLDPCNKNYMSFSKWLANGSS